MMAQCCHLNNGHLHFLCSFAIILTVRCSTYCAFERYWFCSRILFERFESRTHVNVLYGESFSLCFLSGEAIVQNLETAGNNKKNCRASSLHLAPSVTCFRPWLLKLRFWNECLVSCYIGLLINVSQFYASPPPPCGMQSCSKWLHRELKVFNGGK
jgi:hypothetical protein